MVYSTCTKCSTAQITHLVGSRCTIWCTPIRRELRCRWRWCQSSRWWNDECISFLINYSSLNFSLKHCYRELPKQTFAWFPYICRDPIKLFLTIFTVTHFLQLLFGHYNSVRTAGTLVFQIRNLQVHIHSHHINLIILTVFSKPRPRHTALPYWSYDAEKKDKQPVPKKRKERLSKRAHKVQAKK